MYRATQSQTGGVELRRHGSRHSFLFCPAKSQGFWACSFLGRYPGLFSLYQLISCFFLLNSYWLDAIKMRTCRLVSPQLYIPSSHVSINCVTVLDILLKVCQY